MKSKIEKRSPLKDKPLRYAGQSLDEQIEDKLLEAVYWAVVSFGIIFFAITEWFRYFFPKPAQPIYITVFAVIIIAFGIYKVFAGIKEGKRLKMARDGERLVAEGLQELIKQGATVFNDIQGEKFNVDHVVVSPHGIYLIETKTYSKPINKETIITFDSENVYVDGIAIERNPIRQVKALTNWLQNLLMESTGRKFRIHPVILFPGWYTEKTKSGAEIWILNPKALPSFISNEPVTLKEPDVYLAAFHLSRYVRTFTPKEG